MQRKICVFVLFFVAANPINGLKLLVDENYVEDDDETWESDIAFSYKPYQGWCDKLASGTDGEPAATPAQGSAGVGGMGAPNCVADKAKGPGIGFGNLKKFVHYVAKLAGMSNMKFCIDNVNCGNDQFIKSFSLSVAGWSKMYYQNALGGNGDSDVLCYSTAGMTWAKNDPIVKNMDGEEFEITATGTFSLLVLKQQSETLLEVSTFIDRAGTRCGATYIQNMTLSGQWVEHVGVPRIQIKAVAAVPKTKALQVNFDGQWQHAASRLSSAAVQDANAKMLRLKLNRVGVVVTLDSHRIQEGAMKTKRFANFLNVNFEGISNLGSVSVDGLLGRASHEAAVELPEGCEPTKLISVGEESQKKMLSHFEMS